MTRLRAAAVLGAVALAGACAARVPVVTTLSYPAFLFPTVPPTWTESQAAEGHEAAWAYLQTGDLGGAASRYVRLLERHPTFHPAAAGLAWVRLAQGDAVEAETLFGRAAAADPGYVPALVGRGEAFLALGQSEAALAAFESALAAGSDPAELSQRIAELQFSVVSAQLAAARAAADSGRDDDAVAVYSRVLERAPDSGFVHVELGRLERRRGNDRAALGHARRARDLDPNDADAWALEGELLEGRDELDGALAAYERADAVAPSPEGAERVDRVRAKLRQAAWPAEVHAIPAKPSVTRGELAVLLGLRLRAVLAAHAGASVIITDTRDHWARSWIQEMADTGVMQVDAASRFEPFRPVRRGELAEVVAAALDLIDAPVEPTAAAFSDMDPSHLNYEAAARAVMSGVLDLFGQAAFQPARLVSGSEAEAASERLAALLAAAR